MLSHIHSVVMPKVLDVERMLSKSATPTDVLVMETPQQQMENHPVIRTLYDHNGVSGICSVIS